MEYLRGQSARVQFSRGPYKTQSCGLKLEKLGVAILLSVVTCSKRIRSDKDEVDVARRMKPFYVGRSDSSGLWDHVLVTCW